MLYLIDTVTNEILDKSSDFQEQIQMTNDWQATRPADFRSGRLEFVGE